MIDRSLYKPLQSRLFSGKTILLTGPRQVGKTTLLHQVLMGSKEEIQFFDGDDPAVRSLLEAPNTEQLRQLLGSARLILIDEAQGIPRIGLTAKIITDQFKDKQLIMSGSSSFDLGTQVQEPLTGRKWTFELFPVSWEEWQNHRGYLKAEQDLENRLIYGLYPDVLNYAAMQRDVLSELVDSYLYKDVLSYAGLRKPEVIRKLVQALAYQVGNEVAYRELGELTGLDPKTVGHYIDILEKAYVLIRLPAFSRNLRNEIKSTRKIYFYDNGVRNAVIDAFQPWDSRPDKGALWENFLISERWKQLRYHRSRAHMYFWRTKQRQEVDYVEEHQGRVSGFEFKWNARRKIKGPKTFQDAYRTEVKGVTRDNFRDFVLLP